MKKELKELKEEHVDKVLAEIELEMEKQREAEGITNEDLEYKNEQVNDIAEKDTAKVKNETKKGEEKVTVQQKEQDTKEETVEKKEHKDFSGFESKMKVVKDKMAKLINNINAVYDEIEAILEEETIEVKKSVVDLIPWFMADRINKQKAETANEVDQKLIDTLKEKKKIYESILKEIFETEDDIKELLSDFYGDKDSYEYISKNLDLIPNCSEKFKLIQHLKDNYNPKLPFMSGK